MLHVKSCLYRIVSTVFILIVSSHSQKHKASNRCSKVGQTYPAGHPNVYSKCFQTSNGSFYENELKCRRVQYYNMHSRKCSRIPGGGYGITHHELQTCPANFIGLLTYRNHPEFYHVCGYGPHFVAQCCGDKIFDASCQKCVQKQDPITIRVWDDASTNATVPNCEELGTFPIQNHSQLYYKCFAGSYPILYQEVHQCETNTTFDVYRKRCVLIRTPCNQAGRFGVSSNCTRYYRCKELPSGKFRRKNYVCSAGQAFDALKKYCVPKHLAKCLFNSTLTTRIN